MEFGVIRFIDYIPFNTPIPTQNVPMKSPLADAYLRFLQLSRVMTQDTAEPLGVNEKALLEAIAMAWNTGAPLSVREAISIERLGSPATLHKRLVALRTKGLVWDIAVNGDRRTKRLGPTEKALEYFDKLGKALVMQRT